MATLLVPEGRFARGLAEYREATERAKNDGKDLASLEATLDLDLVEAFAWQEYRATAQALGIISADESRYLWRAIGETDGWPKDTDLVTKVFVTEVMAEVIGAVKARR